MASNRESILNYIRAKDTNHPRLMERAFAPDAALTMTVRAEEIAFPPRTDGVVAIADVLVRRFAQRFENVFTFCLSDPPGAAQLRFQCDWLVGMSEKDGGAVRVGCGRYDWSFASGRDALCERLEIGIDLMQSLPAEKLGAVLAWLSTLPYPWCARSLARESMPVIEGLAPIAAYLGREVS